ncbi:carboxypeptidase-like regulatory domain-containing protein [Verrucomicrobiaceae bacterium 227]
MTLRPLIALLALLLASCTPNVRVVDENGAPISNARIIPAARSLTYPPVATNANGEATIQKNIPTIEYLHVFMTGFEPARDINFDLPKPIEVVLKRQ